LQSRGSGFLFRLGQYGTALTSKETASRHFGFKRLHRMAVTKIHRIDDVYMK
jgi:hypothetical protein